MPKNIRQKVRFNADPKKIYAALMESKLHSKFTGAKAAISTRVGGTFSAGGGFIQGVNLELVPGKRIVQAWRGKNWPKGAWSTVTYQFERLPGGRTLLTFSQSGVPNKHAADIRAGWRTSYWKPLRGWLFELTSKAPAKKTKKKVGKKKKTTKKKTGAKKKKAKRKATKKASTKKARRKATKKSTAKRKTRKKAVRRK